MKIDNQKFPWLISRKSLRYLVFFISSTILFSTMTAPSNAEDYSCLQSPDTLGTDPDWKTSGNKDLKFVVSWAFKDPENCIVGIDPSWDYKFQFPKSVGGGDYYQFPATWKVSRDGEMALVSAETEFPVALLQALNHIDNSDSDYFFTQLGTGKYKISAKLKIKKAGGYITEFIEGNYGFPQLWGHWFSKNQGIAPDQCNPDGKSTIETSWKILESGKNSKLEISLSQENNCIFMTHAGPLEGYKVKSFVNPVWLTQAEYPFWSGPGTVYFKSILAKPKELIQIGVGDFIEKGNWDSNFIATGSRSFRDDGSESYLRPITVAKIPSQVLSHEDSVVREKNVVKINTTIDGSKLDSTSKEVITILLGIYAWYESPPGYSPSGWNVSFSGNSWTARYSKGGSSPPGTRMSYENVAIKIPVANLFLSADEQAAIALKAKQEADAKAAAELKAKQEAEAKAAAELKAKQEAEAKAAAERIAAIKAAEEAEAGAREAEIKAAEEEAKAKAAKKTTITCIKGKLTKKVTAVKPKCPSGYKKKS